MRILVFVIGFLMVATEASAQPTTNGGATAAAFAEGLLTITGAGFGEPGRTSAFVLIEGGTVRRIPSTAVEITHCDINAQKLRTKSDPQALYSVNRKM